MEIVTPSILIKFVLGMDLVTANFKLPKATVINQ